MNQEVIMLMGCPASGKGTLGEGLNNGHTVLNRDKLDHGREKGWAGTKDLLPKFEQLLLVGDSILLDNTFPTAESRKPFLELAQQNDVPVHLHHMTTKSDDALINSLWRMMENHGKIFYTPQDIASDEKATKCPNTFPTAAIFTYFKKLEVPSKSEGFASITKHKFKRRPLGPEYCNGACIFDYDDTLRTVASGSEYKYPTKTDDLVILPGRKEKLQQLAQAGELLLGVSNQSGIERGHLTEEEAVALFVETNKQLGVDIDFCFCKHNVPPRCYCRKPQSGLGVALIEEYKLDPTQVTYVGDQTTDKTWAKRLGFTYVDESEFFA